MSFTYIADCTTEKDRHKKFGWAHGILGLGIGIGPWIGYVLRNSPTWLFNTAAFVSLLAIIWTIILLPESHSEQYRDSAALGLKNWRARNCSFVRDVFNDRFVTMTALVVGFAFLRYSKY